MWVWLVRFAGCVGDTKNQENKAKCRPGGLHACARACSIHACAVRWLCIFWHFMHACSSCQANFVLCVTVASRSRQVSRHVLSKGYTPWAAPGSLCRFACLLASCSTACNVSCVLLHQGRFDQLHQHCVAIVSCVCEVRFIALICVCDVRSVALQGFTQQADASCFDWGNTTAAALAHLNINSLSLPCYCSKHTSTSPIHVMPWLARIMAYRWLHKPLNSTNDGVDIIL